MDSLTHIALGACIGELVAGRKLGKKAMALGALAQSIPDIDIVGSFWLSPSQDLLAHRGITHSLLFALLLTPLLSVAASRLFRKDGLVFSSWLMLWGIELFTHLFLDIFNVYGTGLFEPFSHYRVSLNTFFVVDPLFSLWPVIALAALILLKTSYSRRKPIIIAALCMSAVYMGFSVYNKLSIDRKVRDSFVNQSIQPKRYFTTPTPFNNLLWYVVAENDSGYYVGYRSVFDRTDTIKYRYAARNELLLNGVVNRDEISDLIRFSQGYYVVEKRNDTIVFCDLRFGEMAAGLEAGHSFAFYYFLSPYANNSTIIQRGRFAHWNKDVISAFITRIFGKQ